MNQVETCSECGGIGQTLYTECCEINICNTVWEKKFHMCSECKKEILTFRKTCSSCNGYGIFETPIYLKSETGNFVKIEWEYGEEEYDFEFVLISNKQGIFLNIKYEINAININIHIDVDPDYVPSAGTNILKEKFQLPQKFIHKSRILEVMMDLCRVIDLTKIPIIKKI